MSLRGALPVLAVLLALAACNDMTTAAGTAAAVQAPMQTTDLAGMADALPVAAACPVLDSSDWTAEIAGGMLTVTGIITLPTPDFAVDFALGMADRSAIPTQRLALSATPPEGMVAQVIDTRTVTFTTPALTPHYRAVIVTCGTRELAQIADIGN